LWEQGGERVLFKSDETIAGTNTLVLETMAKGSEIVMQTQDVYVFDHAYKIGNQICFLGGHTLGSLEYWCLEKFGQDWKLTHTADLGSANSFFVDGVSDFKITGIDKILGIDSAHPERNINVPIEITEVPLVPDEPRINKRLVLVNGKVFKPKSDYIPGAIWDQPLEKIMQDHEARKLKSGAGMKTSKQTPSDAANSGNDSKLSTSESGNQSANTRWFAVAGVAVGLIGAIVVWRRSKRE